MTDKIVVLVTCSSVGEGARMARVLVRRRLAACVNVLRAPVRSTYRWKGRVETATERLLLIKSSRKLLTALCREIRRLHSYALPEVIALPISGGSPEYLRWMAECLHPAVAKKTRKKK